GAAVRRGRLPGRDGHPDRKLPGGDRPRIRGFDGAADVHVLDFHGRGGCSGLGDALSLASCAPDGGLRMSDRSKLWFGFLGGALAWFAHLLATSIAGEAGCVREGSLFVFLGVKALGWFMILASAVTLTVAGGATWVAWRYRKSDQEGPRAMGQVGFMANLIFVLVIVAQILPI